MSGRCNDCGHQECQCEPTAFCNSGIADKEAQQEQVIGFHANMTYDEYKRNMVAAYKVGFIEGQSALANDRKTIMDNILLMQHISKDLNII